MKYQSCFLSLAETTKRDEWIVDQRCPGCRSRADISNMKFISVSFRDKRCEHQWHEKHLMQPLANMRQRKKPAWSHNFSLTLLYCSFSSVLCVCCQLNHILLCSAVIPLYKHFENKKKKNLIWQQPQRPKYLWSSLFIDPNAMVKKGNSGDCPELYQDVTIHIRSKLFQRCFCGFSSEKLGSQTLGQGG